MAVLTYYPQVFAVPDEATARRIILTNEGGETTDQRWERETPYLAGLIGGELGPGPESIVIDFGCGIGRMSKALIELLGCRVLGVDQSQEMRALAPTYVNSPLFSVVSPEMLQTMVDKGLRAECAISIWVLQHCLNPRLEIDLLVSALVPGGKMLVVNNTGRAVPTREKGWADDGQDVAALLEERMTRVAGGSLDPAAVPEKILSWTFWGAYQRSA